MTKHTSLTKKADKLIVIGQISVYFGFLILTLRHFFVYPANHYMLLMIIMLVGFFPSFLYKLIPLKLVSYLLVGNALLIVSLIFILLREWALAGVFILVPVFSLLFQDKKIYIISSICSLFLNIVLALWFLFDANQSDVQFVFIVLTVFIILVFIIYFVVKDLRWRQHGRSQIFANDLDAFTKGGGKGSIYARAFGESGFCGKELNMETVYSCGLIHDVGKLSIPDRILFKKSRLTEEEYQIMKTHTTVGAKLCNNLNISQEIILGVQHHHERWDGKGYPFGLKGEQIPLIGRVLCVADSIDAMCSNRAYRNALDMEIVLGEIKKCNGTQFDPSIVHLVLERWEEIQRYYNQLKKELLYDLSMPPTK